MVSEVVSGRAFVGGKLADAFAPGHIGCETLFDIDNVQLKKQSRICAFQKNKQNYACVLQKNQMT